MDDHGDPEANDLDVEPPAPDAIAVARRAIILAAVVCRANMELYDDEEDRQLTVASLPVLLDRLHLWPFVDPQEEKILRAPLDTLDHWQRVRGTWYIEGLAILYWGLHRLAFPPHDHKVSTGAVASALYLFDEEPDELLAAPALRSAEEIDACREWFYSLHCSLRGFLRYGSDGHLPSWVGQHIDPLHLPRETVMIAGGVAFAGGSLAEADLADLEEWESVVCERHRAAMWLKGDDDAYTEISVDT